MPYQALLLLLLLCTCAPAPYLVGLRAQNITKVEPPNWYVGFVDTELQLLVYGEAISDLKPTVDYPGVTLRSVTTTTNPNYLFLNLEVSPQARAGTMPLVFRADDGMTIKRDYVLEARRPETLAGFDQSDVLYLITPDRFANGDPANDEVAEMTEGLNRAFPGGRHGGDLKGIQDKLDYLNDLGVTTLWLNPVLENNMKVYSYHGYATTDYYRVDPRYGSNESYRTLCREAAERGMKMVMDIIPNHCGSFHWFVLDPPTEDWINYGGEFVNTNHRRTTVQDPHASAIDTRRHVDGWFVEVMPDLNQRNPLMAKYLTQNALWWIEYAGLGGLRVDTYPYSDKKFLSEWTAAIRREYPQMSIVGEEWSPQPAIISYWQAGKVNHDGYVSHLPQLMDFPLQIAVAEALNEREAWNEGFVKIYETLALDFLYADYHNLVTFPDNHDMDRIFTQVGEDIDRWKMALMYHLTTRGIPQLYYGTEILMSSAEKPGDHGVIRSDFPGGWPGDAVNAFTGKGLSDEARAAQDWLRKLLNWRKTAKVIHHGKLTQFAPQHDGVYVYFRYDDTNKVMVVLNKNEEPFSLSLEQYRELLPTTATLRDVLSGQTYPAAADVVLPGEGAYLFAVE